MRPAIVQAAWAMLEETGTLPSFARELARELDWRCSDGDALRRCRQYFNGQHYRHLPAVAIVVAIRVSGLDYVTPMLLREAILAEERQADDPARPGVRPVRTGRERHRAGG